LGPFAAQGLRLPAYLLDVVDYDSCRNAGQKIHAESQAAERDMFCTCKSSIHTTAWF
jgi:hypothetical protein